MWHAFLRLLDALADLWVVKALVSLLFALFGPFTDAHQALLIAMVADLITGLAVAGKNRELSARTGRTKTVAKLLGYSGVLLLAYQVEKAVAGGPFALGANFTLSATLIYLTATEALSVLENLNALTGLRLKLFYNPKDALERLKGEGDKGQT